MEEVTLHRAMTGPAGGIRLSRTNHEISGGIADGGRESEETKSMYVKAMYDSKKVMRISFLFPALPSNGVIVARCIGALEICG
jgi:hypothetical protein